MSRDVLPDNLKDRRHDDYAFWPLTLIPRAWTSFGWGVPELAWGNQTRMRKTKDGIIGPAPIGERGSWQISFFPEAPLWVIMIAPLLLVGALLLCLASWWFLLLWLVVPFCPAWYFAYSFKDGHQWRSGSRWDDVDNYVAWPDLPTMRVYEEEGEQNTKDWT